MNLGGGRGGFGGGGKLTVTLPADLALNASVQDDGWPRDSAVTSTWRQVSGPGTVTSVNPNQAATRASVSQPGTYELELSARDSELDNSVQVTVTVKS